MQSKMIQARYFDEIMQRYCAEVNPLRREIELVKLMISIMRETKSRDMQIVERDCILLILYLINNRPSGRLYDLGNSPEALLDEEEIMLFEIDTTLLQDLFCII